MLTTLSALLALASSFDYRTRFPLPNQTVPNGWGVNIHFADEQPGELAQIAKAGFSWVRMDFFWSNIERTKGNFDFAAYDRLMAGLKRNHLRPIFILDYGNDIYSAGSPRTPEARTAFCRYVEASVRHYRGQGVIWEMWNEPNISFWQPKPNVEEYIALAKATGEKIRTTAPEEWFIGPATSTLDWAFLEGCFKAGLLGTWDAVSVHPYRQEAPETVILDWGKLRNLVDTYSPKKHIPFMSGEWGYSTGWANQSEKLQADYVARQYLTNVACGVSMSIYYDWKDDGSDAKEPEHHFGVVGADLKPKAAFLKVQSLVQALRGFRFVRQLLTTRPDDMMLLFAKGRDVSLVAWTSGDAHNVHLEGLQKPGSVSPLIEVSGSPQIVALPRGYRTPKG